jgi:hypothetical protein
MFLLNHTLKPFKKISYLLNIYMLNIVKQENKQIEISDPKEDKILKTPLKVRLSVAKYQKNNREKMNLKTRIYYQRLKQDPIRFEKHQQRQKLYRQKQKQKRLLKKLENEIKIKDF